METVWFPNSPAGIAASQCIRYPCLVGQSVNSYALTLVDLTNAVQHQSPFLSLSLYAPGML